MELKITLEIQLGDAYSDYDRLSLSDTILKGIKSNTSKILEKYKGCLLTKAHAEIENKK